jgi:hypothetical protein
MTEDAQTRFSSYRIIILDPINRPPGGPTLATSPPPASFPSIAWRAL